MKSLFLIFAMILSTTNSWAAKVVIQQDVEITEPGLVKLLQKAYVDSGSPQADGGFIFANVLKCSAQKCFLLKGQWLATTEPSYLKGVMYTPKEDSAVFDLTEYMRVQANVVRDGGNVMRTKTLTNTVQGKEYALICNDIVHESSGRTLTAQCVLYNGLRSN